MRYYKYLLVCVLSLFVCSGPGQLNANTYYEGTHTFRGQGQVDYSWLVQFLPYNPVIVECGAYTGNETIRAAKVWPKGKVIAFEANPNAFEVLRNAITKEKVDNVEIHNLAVNNYTGTAKFFLNYGSSGDNLAYAPESSLLEPSPDLAIWWKGPKIDVPCVHFDDWCKGNGIDHIDILRLELEGGSCKFCKVLSIA